MLIHSGEKPFSCNQCTSSHKGITSNSTHQHIQGRSISAVISATSHATMLVVSRYTCGSILEKNPLHAISATMVGICHGGNLLGNQDEDEDDEDQGEDVNDDDEESQS